MKIVLLILAIAVLLIAWRLPWDRIKGISGSFKGWRMSANGKVEFHPAETVALPASPVVLQLPAPEVESFHPKRQARLDEPPRGA